MSLDRETIRKTIAELMPSAKEFLCRLISFPSTSGKEHELFCWAEETFQRLGVEVRRVALRKPSSRTRIIRARSRAFATTAASTCGSVCPEAAAVSGCC